MNCPRCPGLCRTTVESARETYAHITRTRRCHRCRARFETTEHITGPMVEAPKRAKGTRPVLS